MRLLILAIAVIAVSGRNHVDIDDLPFTKPPRTKPPTTKPPTTRPPIAKPPTTEPPTTRPPTTKPPPTTPDSHHTTPGESTSTTPGGSNSTTLPESTSFTPPESTSTTPPESTTTTPGEPTSTTPGEPDCPKPDPPDTPLCYPFPSWTQPDPYIWNIQGVTIYTVWWWWIGALRKTKRLAASGDSKSIKVMREIPKRFIKAVDDKDVENRLSDQARNLKIRGQWYPDWREYYWQIDCPYRKKWMYSFMHRYYGRCYLMYLWNFHVTPYTECMFDRCRTRCWYLHPHLKNAVCRETNYRRYTRWMWCPWITKWCKIWPCLCFRKITFRLPMNCKCWQCWCRWNTLFNTAALKAVEEPEEEGDIDDDGPEPPEGFEGEEDEGLG